MAIEIYESSTDFNDIKDSLIPILGVTEGYFDDVSSILMLIAKGNVISGGRPIQKNISDVKNFFPVIIRNDYVDKWR